MDLLNDIFSENNLNNSSEKIIEKVRNGEWEEILRGLCYIKEKSIILNYIYFRNLANEETYDYILNYIIHNIDNVLNENRNFIVHVNMKNLTVNDINKHKNFIQVMSTILKERYPEKLLKCYIYNAPFIFAKIFNIVSIFIDKETQKKIELVNK
jgi:sulfatase maturation enzyme AslB (radical SAM superfamily)